ncbi:Oidioi.mRNA.OKI2018_I69.chr1.g3147.t1.cds [Oikopleura dioica]|uniref:Mediator of RNA polymerase II transcription subunit 30 n=1 Tax=Oikopleura dioica TaxID=34765 RepID=A0ABN7SWT8_OIKDI|nr:Oidioi.mRNA.OKI2018_I69.chr1.g3147.t1.cds [Oikopleura dioica]
MSQSPGYQTAMAPRPMQNQAPQSPAAQTGAPNAQNAQAQNSQQQNPQQQQQQGQSRSSSITSIQLCQMATELISEIVSRTTELCTFFRTVQVPTGSKMAKHVSIDRRKRMVEGNKAIQNHFVTLNVIHHRLQEQLQDDEEIPFDLKSLIPYVENAEVVEKNETQEILDLKAQRDQLLIINDQKNQQMLETMKIMRLILQDINMDIKPDVIRPDGR